MDAIATRGHVILDDAPVRLRTCGAAQRFTDLFALKADSSTVSTGLGERHTASQVTAEITAAIAALTGSAPALLNTLEEIANAINDDNDVYQTLLSLINSKQARLLIPKCRRHQSSIWHQPTKPRSYRKRNPDRQYESVDFEPYRSILGGFHGISEHCDERTGFKTSHTRFRQ